MIYDTILALFFHTSHQNIRILVQLNYKMKQDIQTPLITQYCLDLQKCNYSNWKILNNYYDLKP